MPEGIKHRREEDDQEGDDAEPHVDEPALILFRRRRSDAKDEGQSTKNVG